MGRSHILKTFLILTISIYISGCSYAFREKGALEGKRLFFQPFINKTNEPNLGNELSRMVLDELSSSFRLTENENQAELILEGELNSALEEVYSYTPDEQPREFKITVTGNFKLTDSSGKVLFNRHIEGWGTYPADGGSKENALQEAVELLSLIHI